ncbi:MAG: hypothetical protein RIS94_440 [Pseudomonadota bacterium]|jgi:hypothetical protein
MESAALKTAAATIATLARAPDLRALSLAGVQVVGAIRLCALAERSGLDPVPELTRRHRNFETAFALQDLVRTLTRTWPEPFMVGRPCCMALTPDEATLAAMVRAARGGDREAFGGVVQGFVRNERHEALWNACVHAVALLG